ncbi:MAG: MFS transporter [Candidatus Latescibacteria bacterium]|nr:MFS transporter [Candidatus Latescibacterota bacterium]
MSDKNPEPAFRVGWILTTVALTTMLAPLNSTMIGVALPLVTAEFEVGLGESGWLVIAYLIVMASLQPVAGKLGDRLGHRRMILGGLLYFAFASIGAALAPSLYWLLAFRIQQAIAGAIALPNGTAIMRQVVPAEQRGRRFGLVGAAVTLAAAAGPPLGGVLIEWVGWRAVFFVNLFLILPTLVLAWRFLPVLEKRASDHTFDWLGALMLLLVLAGGAGMLTGQMAAGTALQAGGFCIIIVLAVLFLRREWHHPDPVFQPRFFRRRTFAAVNVSISLSNLAMYTTFLVIPLLLADAPGWSSTEAGLILSVMWAPTVVCAPLGGRLADRFGRRWPTVGGLSIFLLGLWVVSGIGAEIALPVLVGGLSLAGVGLGLSSAGMQTAAVESVPSREAGVAAGIFSTSRYIGSITGSSVLPLLYGAGIGIDGFDRVLFMVLVAAFVAVLASLLIEDRPRTD